MKNTLATSLLLLMAAVTIIPSCKKGEDDPFISFRSRKARVAGEWKIISGKGSQSESGPGAENESWSQEGESYIYTDSSGIQTYKHITTYIFEKDGTFSFTDSYNGTIFRKKGAWDFEGGVGDVKKKSRLVITYEQDEIPTWGTFFLNSNDVSESWELKELRHKKMVWYRKVSYSDPNGVTGTVEEEIVFEPK